MRLYRDRETPFLEVERDMKSEALEMSRVTRVSKREISCGVTVEMFQP